jgi:hypothetical protein
VPRRGIGGWGRWRRRWRRRRSGCSRRRVKSVGPCRRPLGPDRKACRENARKRHNQKSKLAPHHRSPSVEPPFRDATNHVPAWRRGLCGSPSSCQYIPKPAFDPPRALGRGCDQSRRHLAEPIGRLRTADEEERLGILTTAGPDRPNPHQSDLDALNSLGVGEGLPVKGVSDHFPARHGARRISKLVRRSGRTSS